MRLSHPHLTIYHSYKPGRAIQDKVFKISRISISNTLGEFSPSDDFRAKRLTFVLDNVHTVTFLSVFIFVFVPKRYQTPSIYNKS